MTWIKVLYRIKKTKDQVKKLIPELKVDYKSDILD